VGTKTVYATPDTDAGMTDSDALWGLLASYLTLKCTVLRESCSVDSCVACEMLMTNSSEAEADLHKVAEIIVLR